MRDISFRAMILSGTDVYEYYMQEKALGSRKAFAVLAAKAMHRRDLKHNCRPNHYELLLSTA